MFLAYLRALLRAPIEVSATRIVVESTYRTVTNMEDTMATQADVDALTTKLGELRDTLVADDSAIQSEIDTLKGQGVDVSGLQSAVDALSSQVDATSALVAAPDPTPAPVDDDDATA